MIGLGKMGRPMVRHLVAKGYSVTGFDINEEVAKAVGVPEVKIVSSPAAVAAESDLVIVVVGFDSEVDSVIFAQDGLLEGANPGMYIAIAATVAPGFMRELPSRVSGKEVVFLDTPLCRGEGAAEAGKLLVMGGGDENAFNACQSVFEAFADAIYYLGNLGAGQVGKMVNNLILWACISANYEGLKLGRTLGLEEEPLRQALIHSSAQNWALDTWLEQREMPWAEKDMLLVLQEADVARITLPLCGAVKEVIKGVKIERGYPMPKAIKGQ